MFLMNKPEDAQQVATIIIGKRKEGPEMGPSSMSEMMIDHAASQILTAIKEDNVAALKNALKAFYEYCDD